MFEKAGKITQSFLMLQSFKIQSFSNTDILKMIDPAKLQSIKESDPHPFFQLYSIIHEGVSNSKVLNDISKPIVWTRKAIQSVGNAISKGLKLFFRHNKDNSTDNRKELGEVVAHTEKDIDGKLHQLVVTYHTPQQKEKASECDICSHEGNWDLLDRGANYLAKSIHDLTGIALSKSVIEKPAFQDTKRLAMVQSFEYKNNEVKNMSEQTNDNSEAIKNIRQQIIELNIQPHQLYKFHDFRHDIEKGKTYEDGKYLKDLFDDVKEQEKELAEVRSQLKDALKTKQEFEENNKNLLKQTQMVDAKQRLTNLISQNNLTDKQKEFITSRFKDNSLDDLSDDGLKKFVDSEVTTYKELAKYYDSKESNLPNINQNEGDTQDMLNPDNNPLINKE